VSESITDGPGIRFALFLQGCSHRCPGCHNPETHDPMGGKEITLQDVIDQVSGERYAKYVHGFTFSGGEPFEQAENLIPLAKELKKRSFELASYTGYTFEGIMEAGGKMKEFLELMDVLIDGPFILAQRSLSINFRGSKNQRILDVKKSLEEGEPVLMHDGRWDI